MKLCFLLLCLWSNALVLSSSFQYSSAKSRRRNSDSELIHSSSAWDSTTITKQKAPTSSIPLYYPNIFTPSLLANDWGQFCPPLLPTRFFQKQDQSQHQSYAATVEWNPDQGPPSLAAEQAARELLSKIAPHPSNLDPHFVQTLKSYLLEFYNFCGDQLNFDQDVRFKARLVASRGASGTSCPLWHIDKVPVRWIQALAGPGCQLVQSEDGINWDAFDENTNTAMGEMDIMSPVEENHLRVDSDVADIYSANTNEVTFLVGDRWNEFSSLPRRPIVHRSPTSIPIWQGRLLLTQDVLIDVGNL